MALPHAGRRAGRAHPSSRGRLRWPGPAALDSSTPHLANPTIMMIYDDDHHHDGDGDGDRDGDDGGAGGEDDPDETTTRRMVMTGILKAEVAAVPPHAVGV